MGDKVGKNPAALPAAVFLLSAKNRRGGRVFKPPPPPAGRTVLKYIIVNRWPFRFLRIRRKLSEQSRPKSETILMTVCAKFVCPLRRAMNVRRHLAKCFRKNLSFWGVVIWRNLSERTLDFGAQNGYLFFGIRCSVWLRSTAAIDSRDTIGVMRRTAGLPDWRTDGRRA